MNYSLMLHKSRNDMKKTILTSVLALMAILLVNAGLKPGDDAFGFSLKNVDGTSVSLSDYNDQKGVILVFTCNPCPFAKAYEQRIIKKVKKRQKKEQTFSIITKDGVPCGRWAFYEVGNVK